MMIVVQPLVSAIKIIKSELREKVRDWLQRSFLKVIQTKWNQTPTLSFCPNSRLIFFMKESETTRWFPKWRAKNVLTTVRRRNHGLRRRENFFNFDPLNWLKTTLFRTDLERNEAANFPNESWELKKLFLCKKVGRGKASCPHSRWRGPCESLILSGGQSQLKMMSKKRTRQNKSRCFEFFLFTNSSSIFYYKY